MNKSLSNNDIYRLTEGKCNILIYEELSRIDELEKIWKRGIDKYGNIIYYPCVILYETVQNYGHWTCFIRINDNTIEHFDSYGYKPDFELSFVAPFFRNFENSMPHLSWLIANSQYKKIISNNFTLQQKSPDISTCGRWVALRVITWNEKKISLNRFINIFKKYNNRDEIITYLTS